MCVWGRCVCWGQTGGRTLSENSHRLSILTWRSIQTVWASMYPLISSTCSVLQTRAGINIIDVSEMSYLSLWTADVFFKDSKECLDRIRKCRTNSSSHEVQRYQEWLWAGRGHLFGMPGSMFHSFMSILEELKSTAILKRGSLRYQAIS